MKMRKLSAEMEKCLEMSKEHNGLIRRPGGFWTGERVPMKPYPRGTAGRDNGKEYGVPEWYFGAGTIRALVDRGLMKEIKWMSRGDAYFVQCVDVTSPEALG